MPSFVAQLLREHEESAIESIDDFVTRLQEYEEEHQSSTGFRRIFINLDRKPRRQRSTAIGNLESNRMRQVHADGKAIVAATTVCLCIYWSISHDNLGDPSNSTQSHNNFETTSETSFSRQNILKERNRVEEPKSKRARVSSEETTINEDTQFDYDQFNFQFEPQEYQGPYFEEFEEEPQREENARRVCLLENVNIPTRESAVDAELEYSRRYGYDLFQELSNSFDPGNYYKRDVLDSLFNKLYMCQKQKNPSTILLNSIVIDHLRPTDYLHYASECFLNFYRNIWPNSNPTLRLAKVQAQGTNNCAWGRQQAQNFGKDYYFLVRFFNNLSSFCLPQFKWSSCFKKRRAADGRI
ncbi:Oidioi.mRNA.OKI2018_I69.chr2.g6753.t1.cds [Oikopleura dioica]|uniref:Oidioi.mRNA.OKI2018_I69.chr2.g6753.t1.cds n=1 Tax=Oikopleura dioica TaxID=34765 RepID=A0ABN7TAU6_OIKDI|nr:Oidioi.mRNA.OKI2018_I69.chr2.g6753.t1.cds [Oikopleura dioica]